MKLRDLYCNENNENPIISYEVFPPKTIDELKNGLLKELGILLKFNPAFVSLTCSAGGKKDNNSFETLKYLKENLNISLMPHLTCICNKKENIEQRLLDMKNLGIENILALKGDEPEDIDICYRDFRYANELVSYIKEKTNFSIGVAGYPEGHIESPDLDTDIRNLKRKIDAGSDVIFTQLFFENNKLYSYIENVRNLGIRTPIVAGIMPIISFKQIERMTKLANITIPTKLQNKIEKYKDDNNSMKAMGIDYATEQCLDLIQNGIKGLHFYTLNKSYSTSKILKSIL